MTDDGEGQIRRRHEEKGESGDATGDSLCTCAESPSRRVPGAHEIADEFEGVKVVEKIDTLDELG